MDAENQEERFQFGRQTELSMLAVPCTPSVYLHDSLRQEFGELGMPSATFEQSFIKKFTRVQQRMDASQTDSLEQYRQLWEMSGSVKLSSKTAAMRMTIAMEYSRLLSELGQLEHVCSWLVQVLPQLEKQQQIFNARNSDLHVVYFLLAKCQIQTQRLSQIVITLGRIEQLIKGATDPSKKSLMLKLMFLKSKYQEAKGNKEEQYQHLRKATDYIKQNHMESNFASKLNLLFHKLQAKRAKEPLRFNKSLRQSLKKDDPLNGRNSMKENSLHETRKSNVRVRPATATRCRSTLKSLHQHNHQSPQATWKDRLNGKLKEEASPMEFPDILAHMDLKQAVLDSIMMPRPQYCKVANAKKQPVKTVSVTPDPAEEVVQVEFVEETHQNNSSQSEYLKDIAVPDIDVSYALEPVRQQNRFTTKQLGDGYSSENSDSQRCGSAFHLADGILGNQMPRRSLLDEFIDLDAPYFIEYERALFYCSSVLIRLLKAEILITEEINDSSGISVDLKVVILENSKPIVVKHRWSTERFLNCKGRLLEFLCRSCSTASVTCSRDLYDEEIKQAIFRLTSRFLTPVLTANRYRLNLDLTNPRRSSSTMQLDRIVKTEGNQYYRNTSTLDKIKKTTSQFIDVDHLQGLEAHEVQSFRSSLRQQALLGEVQRQSMIRNLSHHMQVDQCGKLNANLGTTFSTVQSSTFWNHRDQRYASTSASKSQFSMLCRVTGVDETEEIKQSSETSNQPNTAESLNSDSLFCRLVRSWLVATSESTEFNRTFEACFDSMHIKCQCSIRNRGKCMLTLTAYTSKPIFGRNQQFFRLEIIPNNSITHIMKFVATRHDIETILSGTQIAQVMTEKDLHELVVKLWPLVSYQKQKVYAGLSLDSIGSTSQYFYRNKLTEDSRTGCSFLSRKLKRVLFLVQRIVKLTSFERTSYLIMSIQKFERLPCFTVCLYSPQTTRNVSFEVSAELVSRLSGNDVAKIFNLEQSILTTEDKNQLLWELLTDRRTRSIQLGEWNRLSSLFTFSFLEFQDKWCLCVEFAGQLLFSDECNWCQFTEVGSYLVKAQFKLVGKEASRDTLPTEQLPNITIMELQRFAVFLQLNFVESGHRVNLRFTLADFACIVLSIPRKVKSHPQLGCTTINFADLHFLFGVASKIVYQCLQETLGKAAPDIICSSPCYLQELHTIIQTKIQSQYDNCSLDKGEKLSMNCKKRAEKHNYLQVLHKRILRYKKRTLLGLFYNNTPSQILVRTEDQLVRKRSFALEDVSLPFVPDDCGVVLLKHCDRRLFKTLRNRLLVWNTCG